MIAKTHWSWQVAESRDHTSAASLLHEPVARQALDRLLAVQMRLELATGVPVALYGPAGQILPGISPTRHRLAGQQIPLIQDLVAPPNWPQRIGQMTEVIHAGKVHYFITPLVLEGASCAQIVLGPLQLFEPGELDSHIDEGEPLNKITSINGLPVLPSWRAQAIAEIASTIVSALSTPAEGVIKDSFQQAKHLAISDQATTIMPTQESRRHSQQGTPLGLGVLAQDASLPDTPPTEWIPPVIEGTQAMQEMQARAGNHDPGTEWSLLSDILAASIHSADSPDEHTNWLRGLVETMPQAVIIAAAPDGQIVLVNRAARRLWPGLLGGPKPEGVSSQPLDSRLSADHYPPEWLGLSVALRQGAQLFRAEVSVEVAERGLSYPSCMQTPEQTSQRGVSSIDTATCDPRQHPMLVSAFPLYNVQGIVSHAAAIFEDLSGLLERERFKDELLLVAAHDARNPLTLISSYAQLLERNLAMEIPPGQVLDRARGRLEEIQEQVRLLTELTEQMYTVTRLQSAQQRPRVETMNLARLMQRAALDQQMLVPGRTIETIVEQDPCIVQGDPAQLQQIFMHLLKNAVRYSHPDKPIRVSLRCTPENSPLWAEVSVRDQGIGIPRASLPHIFKRFYRVSENERRARVAGLPQQRSESTHMGLGLYLCKQLIEHMGGRIWADSVEAQGTTITFTVPLKR